MIHTSHSTHKSIVKLTRVGLMLGCFVAAISFARVTIAAQIPANVRNGAQPPADIIRDHLQKAIKLLASESSVDQKAGRDLIVAEVANGANAAFIFAYAQELNNQIGPALASANLRVRLNAGIAIARVAEKSQAIALLPSVIKLLNDQHEAVALWGLKAAQSLLKPALAANNSAIIPAIIAAGVKFPSDAVAAYDALRPRDAAPAMLPALITATQDLLAARLAMYQSGVPGEPAAEMTAASNLSDTAWWEKHTKPAQLRTAQLLSDLAAAAAQRITSAPTDVQEQLKLAVKQAGSALVAMAFNSTPSTDLRVKLQQVISITVRTPLQQVVSTGGTIYPELKNVFSGLKAPPALPGGTPLPPPATAPSR